MFAWVQRAVRLRSIHIARDCHAGGVAVVVALGGSFAAAVASRFAHDSNRATRKGFCRRTSRDRAALPRGTGRELPPAGNLLVDALPS